MLSWLDSPRAGMIAFLQDYSRAKTDSLVMCYDWSETRHLLARKPPSESQLLYYNDEVYRVVEGGEAQFSPFECLLRETDLEMLIGICTSSKNKLPAVIESEDVFDAMVDNTRHIFTSAFDGEAYLVWSPEEESWGRDKGSGFNNRRESGNIEA